MFPFRHAVTTPPALHPGVPEDGCGECSESCVGRRIIPYGQRCTRCDSVIMQRELQANGIAFGVACRHVTRGDRTVSIILPFRRELTVALVGLALALGSPAALAQQLQLVSPGKLTYGTAATFAPFEYMQDGKFVGFDIEFGEAIAKKMGLEPVIINIEFRGLIPALQGRRIDIINSAMYINPQRAEQVDFVPYMRIGNQIIVRKGNPLNIRSRDDLCGRRVAVTLGGIQENYAREDARKCEAAGRPTVTVLTFPTAQDSALAVRQGRADAHFDSTPGAAKATSELPDIFEVAGEVFEANTLIGIAVRKGDAAMKAAIEAAVREAVADGTYVRLLQKYNLPLAGNIF
jgi:polar amino acid transport system substrate-binding protein